MSGKHEKKAMDEAEENLTHVWSERWAHFLGFHKVPLQTLEPRVPLQIFQTITSSTT